MTATMQRLFLLLACGAIAACTPVITETRPAASMVPEIAILATGVPGFALPANARVVFLAKSQTLLADENATRPVTQIVNAELVNALTSVNVATTHDLQQADAALTWLLASGRRFDDAEIARAFGAMPGLVVDDPDSFKGTLLLVLVDPGTGAELWRATAQGAVATGTGFRGAEHRIREMAQRMVREIPRRN